MKYMIEIIISVPRQKVIELFDNPENLKHWQKGFRRFEHVSGERGKPGAKSKLIYENRRRAVELIETVTVRNLPDEFSGTYEMKGVWNEVRNHFYELQDGGTKWVSHVEFRFSGFFMKLLSALAPGMFKKQSYRLMQAFRDFAEKN